MQLFTTGQGWLLIAAYAALAFILVAIFTRRAQTKEGFLVADRGVGWLPAAFSIAATWVWAPALFVAAEKAYLQGWVGVFWFTVPNIACLVIFAFFAARMRSRLPDGFTLSGYVRTRLSRRAQGAYIGSLSVLAICSFAVQLLAGGLIVSTIAGLNFTAVTIALAAIAVAYSLFSGLRASVFTDYLQMGFIVVVGLVLAPWVLLSTGGTPGAAVSFTGENGEFTSLLSGAGGQVFLTFGLATTIGLLSGPFGDQSFWQRAFAVRAGQVRKAFIAAAAIFAVVPLTMSLLGFVARGSGLTIENTQLTNLATILAFLPEWTALPFMFFILCGLVSTLDSNLCAVASLAGHDLTALRQPPVPPLEHDGRVIAGVTALGNQQRVIRNSRMAMLALAVAAVLLANLPGLAIVQLFVFYGTVRAVTLLPTVIMLTKGYVNEAAVFYGILTALAVCIPISAYGNLTGQWPWIVTSALGVLAISGGITLAGSRTRPSTAELATSSR